MLFTNIGASPCADLSHTSRFEGLSAHIKLLLTNTATLSEVIPPRLKENELRRTLPDKTHLNSHRKSNLHDESLLIAKAVRCFAQGVHKECTWIYI